MSIDLLYIARPAIGGMAHHLRTLSNHFQSMGYSVTMASPVRDPALSPDIDHLPLGIVDRLSPLPDAIVTRRIGSLLASHYDIVHVHGLKAAMLACLAAKSGAPPPPLIITLHNALPNGGPAWLVRLRSALLRWLLTSAQIVVVVSAAQRDDLLAKRIVTVERIALIPNGVSMLRYSKFEEPDRRTCRAALGIADSTCLILSVGRVLQAKGMHDLIAAVERLPTTLDAKLLVAGDGPDLAACNEAVLTRGLAHKVQFLGHRRDIPILLQAADLFVLASHSEGLPLTVLEAMAARRAVVATRVGGVPELVVDGETGLLVPPHHPQALADAIARLVSRPELRATMGEAGQLLVEASYTEERMMAETAHLYDLVVRR